MIQTKLFKSNKTQAVRLPKPVALPDNVKEVSIIAIGNTRLITPVDISWDVWFDDDKVTDDFMLERDQPMPQEREPL